MAMPRQQDFIEHDVLARGQWDPGSPNEDRRWWESRDHQANFVDALRIVIGLDPMRGECRECMRSGRLCARHKEAA